MAHRLIKYKNFFRTCIIEGGFCPRYITVLKSSLTKEDKLDLYTETNKLIDKKMKKAKRYELDGLFLNCMMLINGSFVCFLNNHWELIIPTIILSQIFLNQINTQTDFELKELTKIKEQILEILDDEDVLKSLDEEDK